MSDQRAIPADPAGQDPAGQDRTAPEPAGPADDPFGHVPAPVVEPGPQRTDPLPADRPLRWGILATGGIARAFCANLALLPDHEVAAVGSRRPDSAAAMAQEVGAARSYGSYEEVVADPDVDVVYVATPHALHRENTLLAFEAGKPVLCEKALTLNARDAEELVREARDRRLFLMEAMWMRCNPVVRRLQQLLSRGELGRVRQVRADLGFVVDHPDTHRLLDPDLGGGALLDMGIYPLTFAHLFLGDPDEVEAVATLSRQGVDLDIALSLAWESGAVASLSSSMTSWSPRTASIATDRGRIDLLDGFHHPPSAWWTTADGAVEIPAPEPLVGTGLANEAMEVARCLRNGETESPLVPLDDTVAILRVTDRIRSKIGLRYAADVG